MNERNCYLEMFFGKTTTKMKQNTDIYRVVKGGSKGRGFPNLP